jgi:hypothetical protein
MIYRAGGIKTTGLIRVNWTIGGLIRICVDTVLDADSIHIRPAEWPALRDAIDKAIAERNKENKK